MEGSQGYPTQPPWGSWLGLRIQIRERGSLLLRCPPPQIHTHSRCSLIHPRFASLFHPPRPPANSQPFKTSSRKCHPSSNILHPDWHEKEPLGLPFCRPGSAEDSLAQLTSLGVSMGCTLGSHQPVLIGLTIWTGWDHTPFVGDAGVRGFAEEWAPLGSTSSQWLGSNSVAMRSSSHTWVWVPDPHSRFSRSRCKTKWLDLLKPK